MGGTEQEVTRMHISVRTGSGVTSTSTETK